MFCSRHVLSSARLVIAPVTKSNLVKREFHAASRSPSFGSASTKDIYKMIDYFSPFTEEESQLILEKVNNSSLDELNLYINKTRAAHIERHRNEHGHFKVVEQLLNVKNVDQAIFERFGKSVIKHDKKAMQKTEEGGVVVKKKVRKKEEGEAELKLESKLRKYIKPRPTNYLTEEVRTICAVKFTLNSLSFAQMTKTAGAKERELLSWRVVPAFEEASKNASFEHHKVDETARRLVHDIPQADLYVFEEQMPIMTGGVKDPHLTTKIRAQLLQASLVSLLNGRGCDGGSSSQETDYAVNVVENKVHLMRITVIDELFGLKVGTERVAVHSKLKNLVQDQILVKSLNRVEVSADQWEIYDSLRSVDKDQLGSACLLAIAFDRLFSKKQGVGVQK